MIEKVEYWVSATGLLPMTMSFESLLDTFNNLESEQGKSIFLGIRRLTAEIIAF
jgi:hypothetical protein